MRYAAALVIDVAFAIAGRLRQPPLLLAAVVLTGVVAAIVQSVQAQLWLPAVVLATVSTCGVVCPVLDAAVSRASEFAADRHAAAAGVGPELAAALGILGFGHPRRGWVSRVLSDHPCTARRIEALTGGTS